LWYRSPNGFFPGLASENCYDVTLGMNRRTKQSFEDVHSQRDARNEEERELERSLKYDPGADHRSSFILRR
jgi:hypothetical protein